MKISFNWLKQFIKIDWNAEQTGELLTDLGLEVEGIEPFESVKGGLKGIVVGEVLTCDQHPNADKLKLTTVSIGESEPLQIVCGAPNVAAGQKVLVATIGTELYDKEGKPWKIKKGKIRGEESHGMLCAEDELGLGESHDGIMVLNENLNTGTPASMLFELEEDFVFEIGLTPNRADAMSHFGVARDLKAGLIQKGLNLELITPSVSKFHTDDRTLRIDVEVKDKQLAQRYCGVTLTDLTVKESPKWLKNRLKSIGLSHINNIVDVTNYVLHELGQPLHAFDASKISGQKIEVKTLSAGTKFTTLDGVERELHIDDLMICDAEKPMCIAGVFGGLHSGVTENTTSIFLESAYFNPVSIRKTAKRHKLNTDASFRFERGIDPNITEYALKRAVLLIQEVAGGKVSSDIVDLYPNKIDDHQVLLNFDNAKRLIGQEIPRQTIKEIVTSLDMKINNITDTAVGLTIPAYRNDVTREVDVIEEILRVYGYNNIDTTLKLNSSIINTNKIEDYQAQNIIGNQLVHYGFHEILCNSLTANYTKLTESLKAEHNVEMLNPLSSDLATMRQSMLFSGLEAVAYNLNRQQSSVKFFEFGKTYHNYKEREEFKHLSLFISGNKNRENWLSQSTKSDFFYLKGIVNSVLDRLGFQKTINKPVESDIFSEGLSVTLNNTILVDFGIIKKQIAKTFSITQEVLYANFNWDAILSNLNLTAKKCNDIPKFPEVRRDFALLLDNTITFRELHDIAKKTEKNLLKNINLFDVYTGKGLPENKKSYAISFTFQDDKKTLTDKQIDKTMNKLQASFEKQLGAELR